MTPKWILANQEAPAFNGGIAQEAKARLVGRGFQYVKRIDYNETYAPVVKLTFIEVLMALDAHLGLALHPMEVKSAFLNDEVDKDVYLEQSE